MCSTSTSFSSADTAHKPYRFIARTRRLDTSIRLGERTFRKNPMRSSLSDSCLICCRPRASLWLLNRWLRNLSLRSRTRQDRPAIRQRRAKRPWWTFIADGFGVLGLSSMKVARSKSIPCGLGTSRRFKLGFNSPLDSNRIRFLLDFGMDSIR